jgi:solute carrier family 25 2-oxodicarboxylate transporter 21
MLGSDKMTTSVAFLAGASSGSLETVVNCPPEVIKVRLQSRENLKIYSGTIDAIVKVVRSEGISAVYKGFEPMVLRNFTWNGCFFGVSFYLRSQMPQSTTNASAMGQLFVAGAAGGLVGAVLATPFDVLKTRAQNATAALPYSNSFSGILHLSKHEGAQPPYLSRTNAVTAIVTAAV